ncbi:MAG TPA: phosphopantothenate/pantothenate synthetase [Thermoplasmata archaeon]|nr:phosphopantothenate/pantothenate synthetase [Thermoplasmata archaeon]
MKSKIPKDHPRHDSLVRRERLAELGKKGLVHETGLIAHGRGEAFDYLLGEKTIPASDHAEKVAACYLLLAKNPVISLNGNVVALAPKECIELAELLPAKLEVNVFHRTQKRVEALVEEMKKAGAKEVLGAKADAKLLYISSERAKCSKEGIYSSDVVLVPLEDGDRTEALVKMGKRVSVIDLNPLSRTARTATVTVVDELTRALPNIKRWVEKLKGDDREDLKGMVSGWDNKRYLKEVRKYILTRNFE